MSTNRRGFRLPNLPDYLKAPIFLVAVAAYSSTGFMYFEYADKPELTWLDAIWWSVVTMTTVGFGDYFPATTGGRILVGFPTMLIGVGLLGFVLAQLATFFIRADVLNRKGLNMQQLKDHIILCNYPSLHRVESIVSALMDTPSAKSTIVLMDDELGELDEILAKRGVSFVRGNPAQVETMERAAVSSASRAVILSRHPHESASDTAAVAIALTLRSANPDLHIVAECVDPAHIEVLERAGCNSVVCLQDLTPGLLAHEVTDPGVNQVLSEMSRWHSDLANLFVVPLHLGDKGSHVEVLRRWTEKEGATLVGVRRANGEVLINPAADTQVLSGDAAVLLSHERPKAIEIS